MLAKSTISIYLCLMLGFSYYPLQEIVFQYQNKPITDKAWSILGKREKQVLKICGTPIEIRTGDNLRPEDDVIGQSDKNIRFYAFPRINAFIKNGRCSFSVAKQVRLGECKDVIYAAGPP